MTLESKLELLQMMANFCGKQKMFETKTSILTIREILENTSKKLLLKKEFENLTMVYDKEFPRLTQRYEPHDSYSTRCYEYINQIVKKLFCCKQELLIENLTQSMILFEQKAEAGKKWTKPLEVATRSPPKDLVDVYVVFNSSYLNSVEGLYKENLKMLYVWKKFCKNNKITIESINGLTVSNLKEKFCNKDDFKSDVLFEGYNRHIRNAIAHTTFFYDEKNNMMEYKDEKSHWSSSFNSFELMHMNEKIMIFNFLMDLFYIVLFTYDIAFCPTRIKYPELISGEN